PSHQILFPPRRCLGKRALHAIEVGGTSCEEAETFDSLVHAHAGTPHHLASLDACALHQLRLQRGVDDIRHPMVPLDSAERNWNAGYSEHAQWRGVDDPRCLGELRDGIGYSSAAPGSKACLE